MKKLNQLLIVEADTSLPPLLSKFSFLELFSTLPIVVEPLKKAIAENFSIQPQLVLLHSNLTGIEHLRQFVQLHAALSFAAIIIVSDQQDEELCLLALEAGAEESIKEDYLTISSMRKTVLLSLRRNNIQNELFRGREQLLACIQNTPNVAVQWYNSKGEVLFWNAASERIFGWTAKEAVGKNINELILVPEDENFWLHKIQHLINSSETAVTEEWNFSYKDGREGCCISTLMTIPSFDEEPWVACMDVDITERKKMETELKDSEKKYRALVEQQADAITIFNGEGKILDANSSAIELLQYSRDELRQMNLMDVFLKEDIKQNPVGLDVLARGEATIKQRRMRRKDGKVIKTEVHAKHIWDGQFLACVRDLTERMEVQQKLENEIELSDTIINSLPGLFYLFTKEGQYLRWNRKQQLISGYSFEEIKKMQPLDFVDGPEKAMVQNAIDETFQKGHSFIEANLLTKQGDKIPFYFTGTAIEYANTSCLLGTGIDLSELKYLEKELAQQKISGQKKLMQAMIDAEEKEKAKLGLELHDNINQILSVVRMYLSILSSGKVPEGVTLNQTMHLVNMAINEIRDLSHSLAVSYKFETGLKDALEEMISKIKLTRDFSIELTTSPALDDNTNEKKKLAIYRIIQEQLNNIIKYAKASNVSINIDILGNEVLLVIADDGQGFDPVKTEKGLGLNNITNRAEALGGNVMIESAPGQGCRIKVSIPLHD